MKREKRDSLPSGEEYALVDEGRLYRVIAAFADSTEELSNAMIL